MLLRHSVIQQINEYSGDDEALLQAVDRLVQEEGESVLPVVLNVFTQLDFNNEEAREIWNDLLRHRRDMSTTLGRPVKLVTAVCDYFLTVRKSFKNPKVVELKLFEEAHHNSKCDPMTGLFNRSYLADALSGEISRSKRQGSEFSMIFLDLDNFKDVNDRYGHLAGDLVLTRIADMIRSEKRIEDTVARYGGEEIVMLLPGTSKVNALVKAERIRHKVESNVFSHMKKSFRVTVSAGVASYPKDATTGMELMDCADKALYRAKAGGKNRIELYSSEKRQFVRVDFSGPVKVRELRNMDRSTAFIGKSKDLSLSGILFESEKPVELGSRLQLEIPIPSPSDPIIVIGSVVRLESFDDHYEVGISFVQMDRKERDEITRYFRNSLNPDPFSH